VPVAPLATEAPPAEVPAAELAEPEQPFFSVMLLNGQPIEFPVEMIGAEQDLGSGPIILEAHGRGVETATHKYIAFNSGDTALYDLTADPDGMNNIAGDPVWAGLVQELSVKLTEFPAPPAPVAAPFEPEVPKVAVPAPAPAPEQPEPASPPTAIPAIPAVAPAKAAPAEAVVPAAKPGLPPLPKPAQVKLPDVGLPPGVGDEPEEASPKAALPVPPSPVAVKPTSIELPQPGLPKPADVPSLGVPAKPKLPVLPKPSAEDSEPEPSKPALPQIPKPLTASEAKPVLPPPPKPKATVDDVDDEDTDAMNEKAELKKALLDEFDTDRDGKISAEEAPSAEQLRKFTTRRREKPRVDRVDNKRKSRLEAESAVKSAMRELEEARLREEMTVREELEAHKATLDKIRRGREQCDEEIAKLKQTDQSRREKSEATIAKLRQEFEHDEELIRHGVRAKKAAQMDDEDRISELEEELHLLHEEETERIRQKEEEDRRREEESQQAHERYLERVKADEAEMTVRQADLEKLDREETELKDDLQSKEDQLQDRLRRIKFEEDDEHSRIEHDVEVLEKSREKFSGQENIEEEEIRTLSAKVDARRIAIADEKKVERRMVAAEHEAERMREEQTTAPIPLAQSVIDAEEPPEPDLEPALPRKPEIKVAKPVEPKEVTAKPALPEFPSKPEMAALPEPEIKVAKPVMPELPAKPEPVVKAIPAADDALPAVIKPGSKPAKPVAIAADEKPAFPTALPALPQPPTSRDLPPLPTDATAPSGEAQADEKPEEKKGFFGRLFGKKKKEATAEAASGSALPAPKTEGPEQELPPLPMPAAPDSGKNLPALPPLPTKKPDLPPIPNAPDMAKEMERKNLERKLERIADDRAERISDANPDLPSLPGSGSAPEKSAGLPVLPKPGGGVPELPALPKPGGAKPDLPPLPKPGVAPMMPPMPKPEGKPDFPPLPKSKAGGAGDLPPLPPLPPNK